MKILATDLDRTLLPNGKWESDEGAVDLFNTLTEKFGVLVIYVTGRNLQLTEKAIEEYGVRYPDVLCSDVGTSIRKYVNGKWSYDHGWIERVTKNSPNWNARKISEEVATIEGMREQEREHLSQFKQSYYVNHNLKDQVLSEVNKRVKGKFDEVIVYSFDSQDGKGLLDFLPACATKQTALEYLAEEYGTAKQDIVFCGDSGNDIFPLTAGFSGVLVRNADDQLIENVEKAMRQNPNLAIYFAKGGVMGLRGYYTSGVIEGACHYGIFDCPVSASTD